jgi:hypothetical protein
MNDKITIVTQPDDILDDGLRILLVGLEPTHTQIVSEALKQSSFPNIIVYMSDLSNFDWMVDKKHKSSIIIFNADHINQTVVGYLAAQLNSYYFGILKTLGNMNKKAIYSAEQIIEIIEENT